MRRFLLTSFLILVFIAGSAFSQEYVFSVLAAKGNNSCQKSNSKKWDKLLAGNKLFVKDKIKIDAGGYVGLVHKSGKTVEIREAGEFTVAQLGQKVATGKANLSSKFASFVVSQLNQSGNIISGGNYKENMETTGAVERSLDVNGSKPADKDNFINLKSPRKVVFTTDVALFNWEANPRATSYTFVLKDRFDRNVFSTDINTTSVRINSKDLNLDKDVYYFWHVQATNDENVKSPDCAFSILSPKQITAYNDTLEMLKKELGSDKSALNLVVLGNFYETNYMFDEAKKFYQEAAQLEPDVPQYQMIYQNIIKRINN